MDGVRLSRGFIITNLITNLITKMLDVSNTGGMVVQTITKRSSEMDLVHKARLTNAIAKTGKKKKDIAAELNMPISTFYNLCAGHVMPGPRAEVAKYLGETVKHLFGGYR